LGYLCKKAVTKVNSNTIEIWYTNDVKVQGGPSVLGQNLGLVLEVERNKNCHHGQFYQKNQKYRH
jgi:GLPGLI family protein